MAHNMDFEEERAADGAHATVSRLHPARNNDPDYEDGDGVDSYYQARAERRPWEKVSDQVRFWFRFAALVLLCCFMIGWPVGMSLSAYQRTGLFSIEFGLNLSLIATIIGLAAIIVVIGELLSLACRVIGKAEELETSAARLSEPDTYAVTNVRSVGKAVRSEITALNSYLDEALIKLASAESLIRQQVQAIDTVGSSLREDSGELAGAVAKERENLIALTEMMNAQADAFAEAIAEKAKLGEDQSRTAEAQYAEAESELEARLLRLEETANKSLKALELLATNFEERRQAIKDSESNFKHASDEAVETSANIAKAFEKNTVAVTTAQQRLQEESDRLEKLIGQQRERADRLAEAIVQQTERLGALSDQSEESERRLAEALQKAEKASTEATAQPYTPATPPMTASRNTAETPKRPSISFANISQQPSAPSAAQPTEQVPAKTAPRGRLTPPAPAATREERQSTSWRDILAKAEQPDHGKTDERRDPPLGLQQVTPAPDTPQQTAPASEPHGDNDIVWIIRQMQSFMVEVETRLYGKPAQQLLVRYKQGERNIFANTLLKRDAADFTEKLKLEVERNDAFERSVFDFLANFDSLLEPDDEDEDDSLIDDYLGSPLGQVYVMVGSALDYFD